MDDECIILLEMLLSNDRRLRRHARRLLGRKKRFPCLELALKSSSTPVETKEFLCGILGRTRWKQAIPVLIALLGSDDAGVRSEAADALAHFGSAAVEAGPKLVRLLRDRTQPTYVRDTAAFGLGMIGYHEAWQDLVSQLSDPERTIRLCSIESLGRLKERQAIPPLQAAFKDEQDELLKNDMVKAIEKILSEK